MNIYAITSGVVVLLIIIAFIAWVDFSQGGDDAPFIW